MMRVSLKMACDFDPCSICDWLIDNVTSDYGSHVELLDDGTLLNVYNFDNIEDALLFKLRWL